MAQSTVSMQLRQFENAMGRPLFERHNRHLRLTEAGKVVLDYAQSIFGLGQEMLGALTQRSLDGWTGFRLGVIPGLQPEITGAVARRVLEADPGAQTVVLTGAQEWLLEELRQRRLDAVLTDVAVPGQEAAGLASAVVGRIPVVFAALPGVARAQHSRSPRSLNGAPFILARSPGHIYQRVLNFFSERALKPRIVAEVPDLETARLLALSGFGIAALTLLSAEAARGGLRVFGGRMLRGVEEVLYLVTSQRQRPNPLTRILSESFRLALPGRPRTADARGRKPAALEGTI